MRRPLLLALAALVATAACQGPDGGTILVENAKSLRTALNDSLVQSVIIRNDIVLDLENGPYLIEGRKAVIGACGGERCELTANVPGTRVFTVRGTDAALMLYDLQIANATVRPPQAAAAPAPAAVGAGAPPSAARKLLQAAPGTPPVTGGAAGTGRSKQGGAIMVIQGGTLYASNVGFYQCTAVDGGAIALVAAFAALTDVQFFNNEATDRGEAIFAMQSMLNYTQGYACGATSSNAAIHAQKNNTIYLDPGECDCNTSVCVDPFFVADASSLVYASAVVPFAGKKPLAAAVEPLWQDAADAAALNAAAATREEVQAAQQVPPPGDPANVPIQEEPASIEPPAPDASSSQRSESIWDKYKIVFGVLIALTAVSLCVLVYFLCKMRRLPPYDQLDSVMLSSTIIPHGTGNGFDDSQSLRHICPQRVDVRVVVNRDDAHDRATESNARALTKGLSEEPAVEMIPVSDLNPVIRKPARGATLAVPHSPFTAPPSAFDPITSPAEQSSPEERDSTYEHGDAAPTMSSPLKVEPVFMAPSKATSSLAARSDGEADDVTSSSASEGSSERSESDPGERDDGVAAHAAASEDDGAFVKEEADDDDIGEEEDGDRQRIRWSRRNVVNQVMSRGSRAAIVPDAHKAHTAPALPETDAAVEDLVDDAPMEAGGNPFSNPGASGARGAGIRKGSAWGRSPDKSQQKRPRRAKTMLNPSAPTAQLFAINEKAELRYTDCGYLYEVPADEIMTSVLTDVAETPHAGADQTPMAHHNDEGEDLEGLPSSSSASSGTNVSAGTSPSEEAQAAPLSPANQT